MDASKKVELIQFLMEVNNHRWEARDNKNTHALVMDSWVRRLLEIMKGE